LIVCGRNGARRGILGAMPRIGCVHAGHDSARAGGGAPDVCNSAAVAPVDRDGEERDHDDHDGLS